MKEKERIIKLPKPLTYQKDIIDWLDLSEVKTVTFLKSRQSGGSFLNKILCIKWLLENNDAKIGYITPTSKLGKLFFSELKNSLKTLVTNTNATDLFIEVKTHSRIQFFSSESRDSIRGFQFTHLILDEAAFMNDEVYNLIIKPTTMIIGRKIVMCSTPNGASGFFHNTVEFGLNNVTGYKTKIISIYDNPFITSEEINLIKSQVPDRVWRQEYLGEFLDGSGTVFTNYRDCIIEKPTITNNNVAAIDWGKQNDYTVLTIMNNKKEVIYTYRINGMDYTNQVKVITAKLKEYKPSITISEENNIGTVVNELLKKEYKGNLKCITLDNSLKKEIIEGLVVAFEQKQIGIPNDDILLRELQAFTCIYNPQTQTVKYSAPNGLHDDCVLSLAYALYATKKMVNNYCLSYI